MTVISRNKFINRPDEIVDKYSKSWTNNGTYHGTTKNGIE